MKTLTIHLGYPKTATTFLQNNLFCKVESSLYFGKYDGEYSDENIGKIFLDLGRLRVASFVSKYQKGVVSNYVGGNERIIISDESPMFNIVRSANNFDDLSVRDNVLELVEKIKHISDGFNVKILLTVRDQSEIIPSIYAQSYANFFSCHKKYKEFSSFVGAFKKGGELEDYLNYKLIDNLLKKSFGADNVAVIPQEIIFSNKLKGTSLLSDILNKPHEEIYKILDSCEPENVRSGGGGWSSDSTNMITYFRALKNRFYKGSVSYPRFFGKILNVIDVKKDKGVKFSLSDVEKLAIKKNYNYERYLNEVMCNL